MEKLRNLWVYGDSFAEPAAASPDCPADKLIKLKTLPWWTIIAEHFHAVEENWKSKNYAMGGTGLDYTYMQVDRTHTHWQKDDIVIVVLTDWMRAWLHPDYPQSSTMWMIKNNVGKAAELYASDLTAKELEHLKYYFTHLHHRDQKNVALRMFIQSLSRLKEQRKLKALVVLDAFPYNDRGVIPENILANVSGPPRSPHYLWWISQQENTVVPPPEETHIHEKRVNHMTWENHKILADKIIYAIDRDLLGPVINVCSKIKTGHYDWNTYERFQAKGIMGER